MEVKVESRESFSWKKAEETIELAYEEHPHASLNSDDLETKNHDIHNFKKAEFEDAVMDSEVNAHHLEGNREIFDGHDRSPDTHMITAKLQGPLDVDLANNIFLTLEKNILPPIVVSLDPAEIRAFEEANGGKEGKLVVEVLFAERSHASDREKYKIYKSGISGCCRKRYMKNETVEFKNIKINYPSSLDKNSKILIVLYHLTADKRKLIREVLISKDLFIIEENKLINIDTEEALHQYFDLFGSDFMDKLPTPFKASKGDKHALNEEISNLEKYLIKKNKKFLNIVYLSFKFPHFCELYFKMPEGQDDQDPIAVKRTALSNALTEATKEVEELKLEGEKPELLCNYLNPLAKLVFRINVNLRRVRIFMRKEFTEILSIVVAEDMPALEGFEHFATAKELKDFYLEYYSFARKCKSAETFKQANNSSAFLQNPNDPSGKKAARKPEDDEYHEQQGEEEDESEADEQSNDGYSGDKKGKKPSNMIKKLYPAKKQAAGNVSPKESKYPTRNKTRAHDCQESSHNESKKNALGKKVKEKELQKKPAMPMGGVGMINPLNPMMPMPFQVIPQAGQNPMMGVFPLMQNVQKKDGQPGQKVIQMGLPPGMQGIPGMQGMPMGMQGLGGMPGMGGMIQGIPGMMPGFGGMPMGMMQPQPQQQAKKDGKEGKEEAGSSAKPGQMPMMMPMMGQGMQGMQMPMMGMQMPMMGGQQMMGQFGMPMGQGMMGMPGMQGFQGIPVMQGPNGQLIMMQMMPQQMQQLQQLQQQAGGQTSNSQASTSNTANSSTSAQGQPAQNGMQSMMQGGMPMGMMMPGGQPGLGFQGMMMPQGMQMGMMGLGGNPLGAQGQQTGNAQGQNPMGAIGMSQLQGMQALQGLQGLQGMQGMQGIPMGFMMPQQANGNDPKNADKTNPAQKTAVDPTKKNESGKKEDKPDIFPPPIDPNAAKTNGGIPNFLNPQGQFNLGAQGKDPKQAGMVGMMPKLPMAGMNPQMMGMPSGGMMLSPEMLQQLQSQGGMPPGVSLFPGMQGMQGVMGGDPMASLTAEQKQQLLMQMQMGKMGFPGMMMPGQPPKKDEEKK